MTFEAFKAEFDADLASMTDEELIAALKEAGLDVMSDEPYQILVDGKLFGTAGTQEDAIALAGSIEMPEGTENYDHITILCPDGKVL